MSTTNDNRSRANNGRRQTSFRFNQKMDVYLDGDDLVLKSPLTRRRTQQMDILPQKQMNQ